MTSWGISLAFAVIAIAVLGGAGFNRPTWSRTYTTAGSFWAATAALVGIYLLIYTLFYNVLRRLIVDDLDLDDRAVLLWSCLVLIVGIRATPPLARRLREPLHRLAGIPDRAQSLGRFLADTGFSPPKKVSAQAKEMLRMRGVDTESNWLPPAAPVHEKLLKATELYIQLREWDHAPKFAPFVREISHELYYLRQRFDRISFRASRALASIEQLGEIKLIASEDGLRDSTRVDASLKQLVNDMITDLCEDIGTFHRDTCVLLARGVMTKYKLRISRNGILTAMGFSVQPEKPMGVAQVFAYSALLMVAGLWLCYVILPSTDPGLTGMQRISIFLVVVMGTLALACLPKFYFGFASGGLHRRTPVAFVLSAGFVSVVFAAMVYAVSGVLIHGGTAGAIGRLRDDCPYLPSTFLTGVTVAWLTQDHRWATVEEPKNRRLLDAGVFALCWLVGTLIGRWLMPDARGEFFSLPTIWTACVGFIFGALVGAAIPELLRKSRQPTAIGNLVLPQAYSPLSPVVRAQLTPQALEPVPANESTKRLTELV